jgi:hypothetical protein
VDERPHPAAGPGEAGKDVGGGVGARVVHEDELVVATHSSGGSSSPGYRAGRGCRVVATGDDDGQPGQRVRPVRRGRRELGGVDEGIDELPGARRYGRGPEGGECRHVQTMAEAAFGQVACFLALRWAVERR